MAMTEAKVALIGPFTATFFSDSPGVTSVKALTGLKRDSVTINVEPEVVELEDYLERTTTQKLIIELIFSEVDTSDLETPPYYRIPPLDREGQNKTLQGEIMVDIQYLLIEYDTLKYSFYILDRAFHHSNVDTTSEIIFTNWKD